MNRSLLAIWLFFAQPLCASNDFNGTSDVLNCGDISSTIFSGTFLFSAWIYPSGGDILTDVIAGKDGVTEGMFIYTDGSTDSLCIFIGGEIHCSDASVLTAGVWQHVAILRSVGEDPLPMTFYVDGVAQGSVNTNADGSGANLFLIGDTFSILFSFPWTGQISDVRVYDLASDDDGTYGPLWIQELAFSRTRRPITESLIGYWPLDDFTDGFTVDTNSFYDRSGNGNPCVGAGAGLGGTARADFLRYP